MIWNRSLILGYFSLSKRGIFLAFILFGMVSGEIGRRLLGINDFPLYQKDETMGYIQKVDQAGSFLNKNEWAINDYHLFGSRYEPVQNSTFLIGDSIVWGGNPYRKEDRLCVMLENKLASTVWCAAAGSWSSWSEIGYMEQYPEVVASCERLVWVFNSEDFSQPTKWNSELTHPTGKPLSALYYTGQKYLLPRLWKLMGSKSAVEAEMVDLDQLLKTKTFIESLQKKKRKIVLVLWPSREELENPPSGQSSYSIIKEGLKSLENDIISFHDFSQVGLLDNQHYRDSVHPTLEGISLLSEYLSQVLQDKNENEMLIVE
jgi:hypothetical protein